MSPHPGPLVWEALSLICSVWGGGAVFRVQASCLRAGSTTTSVCDVEYAFRLSGPHFPHTRNGDDGPRATYGLLCW